MSRALLLVLALACASCATRRSAPVSEPDPSVGPIHVVMPGDTLLGIAHAYRADVRAIIEANDITERELRPGQRLVIPGGQKPAPPPAALSAASKPGAIDPSRYLARSRWTTQAPDTSLIEAMGMKPWRITLHHTDAGKDNFDSRLDGAELLRRVDRQHRERTDRNGKHWACIGYHFVMDGQGRIWEARPITYQGAHAEGDNNFGNIGVAVAGNFDRERLLPSHKATLVAFIRHLQEVYGIPDTRLYGHCDFKDVECPGARLKDLLIELRRGQPKEQVKNERFGRPKR